MFHGTTTTRRVQYTAGEASGGVGSEQSLRKTSSRDARMRVKEKNFGSFWDHPGLGALGGPRRSVGVWLSKASKGWGGGLWRKVPGKVGRLDKNGGNARDENGVQVGTLGECMILYRAHEIHEEPRISVADLPWQSTKGMIVIVPPRRTDGPSQQKSRGSREIKPTTEEQGDMDVIARLCKQASRTHKVLIVRPENAFMSHGIMKYVCEDCGFEKPMLVHNVAGLEGGKVANITSIHISASRHTAFRPNHRSYTQANEHSIGPHEGNLIKFQDIGRAIRDHQCSVIQIINMFVGGIKGDNLGTSST